MVYRNENVTAHLRVHEPYMSLYSSLFCLCIQCHTPLFFQGDANRSYSDDDHSSSNFDESEKLDTIKLSGEPFHLTFIFICLYEFTLVWHNFISFCSRQSRPLWCSQVRWDLSGLTLVMRVPRMYFNQSVDLFFLHASDLLWAPSRCPSFTFFKTQQSYPIVDDPFGIFSICNINLLVTTKTQDHYRWLECRLPGKLKSLLGLLQKGLS